MKITNIQNLQNLKQSKSQLYQQSNNKQKFQENFVLNFSEFLKREQDKYCNDGEEYYDNR